MTICCNDAHLFAPPGTDLSALLQRVQIKLLNAATSISAVRNAIHALNLTNDARLRPSWDQYFMQLADLAAYKSNCMKERIVCDRQGEAHGQHRIQRHAQWHNQLQRRWLFAAATTLRRAACASPRVCASTLKRIHCWKQVAIELEETLRFTAIPALA
ncbi:hypothetical protein IQ07DRAFT_656345 [Pyrenochaeta sp. DS3sAY3a]|nr:hypothetical protein IQ07DRAFT_656345 [Pyrenochaeta sp. DS3sAY3a]